MTELVLPGVVAVEARQGRWIGWCSYRDRCDAAIQLVPFTEGFICPDCGMATSVVWPSADMVAGVERLLLMRPHPKNQNWLPGETLDDLLLENIAHGIFTRHAAAVDGTAGIFGISGDRVEFDALPFLNPRRELVR